MPHQWLFYLFHAHTADNALDEGSIRVQARAGKEVLKRCVVRDVMFDFSLIEASQSRDDLVELCLSSAFLFHLLKVERIHA